MFNFKIVLLFTIVSSSLYATCTGHSDLFSALRNTFGSKLDHIDELFRQQSVFEERRSYVDGNYNDTKCYAEMTILLEAFNATEPWALNGKPTEINFGRTDMKTMIHSMINLLIKSAKIFEVFCFCCFRLKIPIEFYHVVRSELTIVLKS